MARSRLAQMVEDEAQAAESADAEPDDGEGAAEDELEQPAPDEGADEGEPASSEDELAMSGNRMVALLEAEARRHAEVLEGVFGPEFSLYSACPLCSMLGFVAAPSPKADRRTRRCPDCDGVGQVLTGAAETAEFVRQCPTCLGNGHVPSSDGEPGTPQLSYPTMPPEPEAAPPPIPPMPTYDPVRNAWLVNGQPVQVAS